MRRSAEIDVTGIRRPSPERRALEFKPIGTLHAPAVIQAASESLPGCQEEITVGDVTLSAALYRILCEEAKQHLATLDDELQTLQFDWTATPSQLMVRARHTLCGIHRTGGFPLVATTAKALEVCLLGLQERGAPLPGAAQPVLARAIAGLTVLAARVRAREWFRPTDEAKARRLSTSWKRCARTRSEPRRATVRRSRLGSPTPTSMA